MSPSASLNHKTSGAESSTDVRLSNAFRLIDRVPPNTLLAHREEVVSIFPKLYKVILSNASPTKASDIVPRSISALLENLNRHQQHVTKLLSLSEVEAVEESPGLELEDSCSHDCSVPNTAHVSPIIAFRKILDHRSLAVEYEKWQLANLQKSRVEELLEGLKQDQPNVTREGHVTRYVNQHGFTSVETARKSILYGIKLLLLERLCQKTVVSAVLSFAYTKFRELTFKDIPLLGMIMESVPWISTVLSEKEHWYVQCQKTYDGKTTPKLGIKRPTERDIPSSAKRLKSSEENGADNGNGIDNAVEAAFRSPEHVSSSITTSEINNSQHHMPVYMDSLDLVAMHDFDPNCWPSLEMIDSVALEDPGFLLNAV